MSLILAIGPQNLFVIEQGLKRHRVFLVCLICSVSDFIFIAIGTAAFYYFSQSNQFVDLILNLLLLVFIFNFVWNKLNSSSTFYSFNQSYNEAPTSKVVLRTLAFTYLNPHVYSDTIFIIGGFSRELMLNEKIFFVIGAASASFIYFFSLNARSICSTGTLYRHGIMFCVYRTAAATALKINWRPDNAPAMALPLKLEEVVLSKTVFSSSVNFASHKLTAALSDSVLTSRLTLNSKALRIHHHLERVAS